MFNLTADFARSSRVDTFKSLEEYLNGAYAKRFCITVPSTGASEKHEWLAQMPGVKEFLDTRALENLKKWDFTITNKVWEDTLAFTEDELNDMPAAIVKARIPLLAASAAEHLDEHLFDVLVAGTAGYCFDGQYFFSASHPTEDGGTFSNLITGDGTTVANVKTNFDEVIQAAQGIKKRNGNPLLRNLGKPVILHGPALNSIMREAFVMQFASGGANNTHYDAATPISLGDLSGNDWYLIFENKAMKPFIYQEREGWKFEWNENERFMRNKIYYGGKARYAIGYGHPALCYKVDNA